MAPPVFMQTAGLNVYAFDASQLGVFAKPVAPGQFLPLGPGEILPASGALAALDGPEFGNCGSRCAYPQELVYDQRRGVAASGQRESSGMTVSVVDGQVQVAHGKQAAPGASVAVQLYPSIVENNNIVVSDASGTNGDSVGRAALAVISPTRLAFVTARAMPMVQFARTIRDQLGSAYVGYTDGGGSTALVLPGQTFLGVTGERRSVPTWLVVNPPSVGVNQWVVAGGVAALAALGIYWATRRGV